MKTKIFLSSLLAVSLFMVSCKKELQPQESSEPTEAVALDATANTQTPAQPVNMQPQQQPAVQQQVQPQATTTAPGMNPPHGQPNHRCDIAVGAPLNSPPGKNPAQAQAAPAPVQAQPVSANAGNATMLPSNTGGNAVAAGVNPPHGMPGHRCDIAVGAPLPK